MYTKVLVALVVALLARSAPLPFPPAHPSQALYRPPLDRPVSSQFDASHGPYGPGNRGLDYAVVSGDVVGAIGAGTVVFAGPVAGAVWVTVLHPDGLRSSYGPLATLSVVKGTRVAAGTRLGTTGSEFHLGVRDGATYLDPATLFTGKRRHAWLVPLLHPQRNLARINR